MSDNYLFDDEIYDYNHISEYDNYGNDYNYNHISEYDWYHYPLL